VEIFLVDDVIIIFPPLSITRVDFIIEPISSGSH